MKTGAAAAMLACALVALWGWGCDSSEEEGRAALADLTVQVIEGDIHADLMPPVAPDPVVCRLTLRMFNSHPDVPLSGLSIPSATVFLARTSVEMGAIRFETDWDGVVEAGKADTVTVVKIAESQEIFPPPCGEPVFLRVWIVKTAVQSRLFSTPSYGFSCPAAGQSGDS